MRKLLYLFIIPTAALGSSSPAPFPIFLKPGFSSILEFQEEPARAVLGDNQSFQIEKLGHSLVLRTLAQEASSNLFVYFKNEEPRAFILRASEDAEPTYYKKFENVVVVPDKKTPIKVSYRRGARILSSRFDVNKDYLSLDLQMSADFTSEVKPVWSGVRLAHDGKFTPPYRLWSERKEVQRDSKIKIRVVFVKPSVPRDLRGVTLLIPIEGQKDPIILNLRGDI